MQAEGEAPQDSQTSVSLAQQVMDEHTTQLNPHEMENKEDDRNGKKTKFLSRFWPGEKDPGAEVPLADEVSASRSLEEQNKDDRQKGKKDNFIARVFRH